ncbi:MAG TPA: translation initiation factor IF-3 [Candidatus Polarisedimenticolia bacterium]|nr:translation initiation factor IF-3 [Candidatus Polarisedimenticolia bacterium]
MRVNQMIRIPQVRVIDEEGEQLGIMPTARALEMAQERGLDLVEVAPMAAPPVTRFLDFGQYKYELNKREKEAKRKQRSVTFKEVRLSPKIGVGDFTTKLHRAVEFLEDGDRIKVTVRFRGRELSHPELGRNLLQRFADLVKDHGIVERAPVLEGKSMFISIASVHKPKIHEGTAKAGTRAAEEAAAAAAAGTARPAPEPQPAEEAPPKAAAEPKAATEPKAAVEPKSNGAATTEAAEAKAPAPKPVAKAEPKKSEAAAEPAAVPATTGE